MWAPRTQTTIVINLSSIVHSAGAVRSRYSVAAFFEHILYIYIYISVVAKLACSLHYGFKTSIYLGENSFLVLNTSN